MNENKKKRNLNCGQKIEVQNKEKTIIYQYYDLNTFDSVIKNKELWFSDIKKMNDINEGKQVFIFLKNKLKEILKKIETKRKEDKYYEERKEFLTKIEKISSEDKRFEKHYAEIKKYSLKKDSKILNNLKKIRNKIGVILLIKNFQNLNKFISCFSRKGDLLGQWRSYADDGKGIVIGYDLEELKKILKNISEDNGEFFKVNIKEVEYLDENNIKLDKIFNLFDNGRITTLAEYFEDLFNDLELQDDYSKDFFIELLYSGSIERIINFSEEFTPEDKKDFENFKKLDIIKEEVSPFFKHYGFLEEDEIRILLNKKETSEENKKETSEGKSYITQSEFRISSKRNDIIEYIKLVMTNEDFKKVLSEVVIGPNNSINKNDMKNFLLKYKLLENIEDEKIEVKKSKTPYRN